MPVAGGVLDQTESFLAASAFYQARLAKAKK